MFCRHNPSVYCFYFVIDSVRKLLDTPSYADSSSLLRILHVDTMNLALVSRSPFVS